MGLLSSITKVIGRVSESMASNFKSIVGVKATNKDTLSVEAIVSEAFMNVVPREFEGTMLGLRVKYTLDSQLYGLAQTMVSYGIDSISVEVTEYMLLNPRGDVEEFAEEKVEDFVNTISDKELVCKNFWNNKDLGI